MADKELDFSELPIRLTGWSDRQGRVTVEIDADTVSVAGTDSSGRDSWSEPTKSFTGVFRRDTLKTRGEVAVLKFESHIELHHPDSRKTLSIYKSSDFGEARKAWIEAARSLHLPAIEDTPAGHITREFGDLDKSLRDVLILQDIELYPDSLTEPWPDNLVRREGKTLFVAFRDKLTIRIATGLLFMLAGILVQHNQRIGGDMNLVFAAVSFIVGIVIFGGAFVYKHYVFTPTNISSITRTPVGEFGSKSVPLNELSNILWVASVRTEEGHLGFVSDNTVIDMKFLNRAGLAKRLGRFAMATMVGRMPEQ